LIKTHYRKNAKKRGEFEELLKDLFKDLEVAPCSLEVSDPQTFPSNTAEQDFEFRKIRFRMPGLQGAARYGRLLFVVCHSKKIVYLVWLYTHVEFPKPKSQPPAKDLASEVNLIQQEIILDEEA